MTSKCRDDGHSNAHQIPHIKQRFHWDCGITCILMILTDEQRDYFLRNFEKICQDEALDEATWTIDLCYLLKRFKIDHSLYTLRLGINYNTSFKNKVISNKNLARLDERFKNAEKDSLKIHKGVISIEDLTTHTQLHGPAIVLVDSRLLVCDWCKTNKLSSELRKMWGGAYRGHYVVLVGQWRSKLVYLDPARAHAACATSPAHLALARRARGTDEDVVLIFKSNK